MTFSSVRDEKRIHSFSVKSEQVYTIGIWKHTQKGTIQYSILFRNQEEFSNIAFFCCDKLIK